MSWEDRELDELKLDEGLRLKAYNDKIGNSGKGVWTIGYGHTGKEVVEGLVITEAQAEVYLEDDWAVAYKGAVKVCDGFEGLDGPRKGVIVNMAFNLGAKKLSGFHNFLNHVNDGLYKHAAEHMLASLWARQVKDRAKRLAYRMTTGNYALRT